MIKYSLRCRDGHRFESWFADADAFDAALAEVEARVPDLAAFRGTLAQGPERLAAWLDASEALERDVGRLRVWTTMASNVDANDEPARERADRVGALASRIAEATAFEVPELLAIGIETLRAWLDDPALTDRQRAILDGLKSKARWVTAMSACRRA